MEKLTKEQMRHIKGGTNKFIWACTLDGDGPTVYDICSLNDPRTHGCSGVTCTDTGVSCSDTFSCP